MSGHQLGFIVSRCLAVAVALRGIQHIPIALSMSMDIQGGPDRLPHVLPVLVQALAYLFAVGYLWSTADRFCPNEIDGTVQVRVQAEPIAFVSLVILGASSVLSSLRILSPESIAYLQADLRWAWMLVPGVLGLALLIYARPMSRYMVARAAP